MGRWWMAGSPFGIILLVVTWGSWFFTGVSSVPKGIGVCYSWDYLKWSKHDVLTPCFLDIAEQIPFEEDLQRCIFRGRRSTKDMFMRDVRRSGRWFPERGCILEYQMCRFAKVILHDRCSTSYDLASIFRGRRSTLDRWTGKIAKRIGTRLSALHSTFHFSRERLSAGFFQ